MSHLLARLRSAFSPAKPPPDVELLTRFLDRNDQDAFAELVRRYAPMVLGVCRRTLGDGPDAEDAYQAAFLVLAKRAATVRGIGRVAGWLHGVATLCAKKARVRRAKRRLRENAGGLLADVPAADTPESVDLTAVLDEELAAIPEKYRTAVVLCELRQLTLDQAAGELGVPRGTVASRLARGREALGKRLLRRSLGSLVPPVFSADPPSVNPTPAAHSLAREVLRTMTVSNLRWLPLAVLPLVAVGLLTAADPPKPTAPAPQTDEKTKRNATVERVTLVGIGGLLDQEAVRRSLDLSKEQEEKWVEKKRALSKQAEAIRDAAKAKPQPGKELADVHNQYEQLAAITWGYDDAVAELLSPAQQYRMKQIVLQRDGPAALLGRIAVRELVLTPEQEDKLALTLRGLTQPRMTNFIASAAARVEDPDCAKLVQQHAASLDELRAEALKHLTKEQKAKWQTMIGEEIPTATLVTGSGEAFVLRLSVNTRFFK